MAVIEDVPQHMDALRKANAARIALAAIKGDVRAGRRLATNVLRTLPDGSESLQVMALLMSQHRWGRHRSLRLLDSLRIPELKRLGAMTERQRLHLAAALEEGLRRELAPVRASPLESSCFVCGAGPGDPCTAMRPVPHRAPIWTGRPIKHPHYGRGK